MTTIDDFPWQPIEDPQERLDALANDVLADIVLKNQYPIIPQAGREAFSRALKGMNFNVFYHEGLIGIRKYAGQTKLEATAEYELLGALPSYDDEHYTLPSWETSFATLITKLNDSTKLTQDRESDRRYVENQTSCFRKHFVDEIKKVVAHYQESILFSDNGAPSQARSFASAEISTSVYMLSMEFGNNAMGTKSPVDLMTFNWLNVDQERLPHRSAIERFYQGKYLQFLSKEKGYFISQKHTGPEEIIFIGLLTQALPTWREMNTFEVPQIYPDTNYQP